MAARTLRRKVNLTFGQYFSSQHPDSSDASQPVSSAARGCTEGESPRISLQLLWILGFVIFLVGPLLVSLGLMFNEYAGFENITYVDLANFEELIKTDIRFFGSLQVFTEGFMLTQGGPARSTLFYVLYLYIVVLGTMMVPMQVTAIPTFLLFHRLGWLNTYLPLIVAMWMGGGAFYIFLLRQ